MLSVVQSSVPPMDYAADPQAHRRRARRGAGEDLRLVRARRPSPPLRSARCIAPDLHSGEEVVVKIQYPGVEKTVKSDLQNAKALIQTLKLVARDVMRNRDMDYRGVYEELKSRMEEELDYELEAANIELFRKLYADDRRDRDPAGDSRAHHPAGHHARLRRRLQDPRHPRAGRRSVAEGLGDAQALRHHLAAAPLLSGSCTSIRIPETTSSRTIRSSAFSTSAASASCRRTFATRTAT